MNIQISDSFSYRKLIAFTIPSIIMMIITSVYAVVDGIFVSNYVGKDAFAALNLIYPFIMIFGAFGFMLGTGGCALVGKYLGEQNRQKANEVFTMIFVTLFIGAATLATLGIIFIEPIAIALGATPDMLGDCITYGTISLIGIPAFILQTSFQPFVVVADKPRMGMMLSIASGVTNIALDFLFIAVFRWGIAGAALATITGQFIGGIIPLLYFLSKRNNSSLRFTKFKWDFKALFQSCSNGASEMMTSVSMSLVNMLYNLQLMRFIGPDGVSAYGVIMYISFVFIATFIGYTIGASPIISYNYGAQNFVELKSMFKKSIVLVISSAVILTALGIIFARPLAAIFVGYDEQLLDLSVFSLAIYSTSYMFAAMSIFASAFFTALNNGKISAFISFLRTLVLQTVMILLLPELLGEIGIWLAVPVAEFLSTGVVVLMFIKYKKVYNY